MGFATKYLEKHQFIKIDIPRVPEISGLLKYIVIIPSFSEPDIFATLTSLKKCHLPKGEIEVLILVNYSEDCSPEIKRLNKDIFKELKNWTLNNNTSELKFTPLLCSDLPKKHAGAGLARKTLMDTAVSMFNKVDKPDGLIISLDADTLVPKNYFTEIEKAYSTNSETACFVLNFAHPTMGKHFSEEIYKAIGLYELHMRYYKQILESINYPNSFYTIGSCFAVSAQAYVKNGGMNRRKGGEDFYFLQKIFSVEKTQFLKEVILSPSPRPSERVPFGTGPAIRKILSNENNSLESYAPQSFTELEQFLKLIPEFYTLSSETFPTAIDHLPDGIKDFLSNNNYIERIKEIRANCSTKQSFIKRFYNWFDAFTVLKYLNFVRDNYFGAMEITVAVKEFLNISEDSPDILLEILRERDVKSRKFE